MQSPSGRRNLGTVQEVAPGQHSQRRKSKGEIGTGEAPWQPLWAMLVIRSLFPSLNKSIKSSPHFSRSVNSALPSSSQSFYGTSLSLSFFAGKMKVIMEMILNFTG